MMQRKFLSIVASAFLLSAVGVSTAFAEIFLFTNFRLHDFDQAILAELNYDSASVVYFGELGSITAEQRKQREDYEKFGCFPFYLIKNGKAEESGYNCQTFYCVGYSKGPKVCKDRNAKVYGGVVEITRRAQISYVHAEPKTFKLFAESDQTEAMKNRMKELAEIRCEPYYLMLFDSAIGEGYTCEEVGRYPYFSAANNCVDDWRDSAGLTCDIPLRKDEVEQRKKAIEYREGGRSSSKGSSVSSSSSVSSAASSLRTAFPDVLEGQYGYTAIIDLARRGVVNGYTDGYFRPYQIVNRAEFSKLLLGGLHADQLKDEKECFADVNGSAWFSQYVCAAKRLLWIVGYSDGMFHPERTITKAEAMKILIASMGVPLDSVSPLPQGTPDGQWYTPYIRKAMELKLILEPSFLPASTVTRADASVWIFRSLKVMGK